MSLIQRLIPALALLNYVLAASLDWNHFISYDNEFIPPSFLLAKPWEKDNHTLDAAQSVIGWADTVSLQGPWSVTQKPFTASTGDKHDYMSWAPYWWPDCSNAGNTTELTEQEIWVKCKYVDRDGQFVPDVRLINDTGSYAAVCDAVLYTSVAWAITGDDKYANKSIDYIRTWFIDPDTYMNPNLDYSQVIRGPPGNQTGSHYGVLDVKTTAKILTAILLFRETNYTGWTQADDQAMVKWANEFIDWLENDPTGFGKQEMATANNHGSYSYNTMGAFQIMANNKDAAERYLNTYFDGIYQNQIAANGEQPLEAARSRTYHYRAYNLGAMIVNAKLGQYIGLNFWNKTTKAGATIQDALLWAIKFDPAATNEVTSAPAPELYQHVAAVAANYGDPNGTLVAYLNRVFPDYPQAPFFLWNQPFNLPPNYAVSGSIAAAASNSSSTGGHGSSTGGGGGKTDDNAALHVLPSLRILVAVFSVLQCAYLLL